MGDQPYLVRNPRIATLPNLLSLVRVLLLPPTLLALHHQDSLGAVPVLVAVGAALGTDALDGILARGRGWVSDLGRVLDPLADKIYLGGVVLYLTLERGFPAWLLALVVVRDLFLIAAAALLVRRRGVVFGANLWGKVSTVVLSLLVVAFLLRAETVVPLLIAAAVAALSLSLFAYVRNGVAYLKEGTTRPA